MPQAHGKIVTVRQETDEPDREASKTRVKDAALDALLDKADEAMDSLAAALHEMRAKVQARDHA